MKRMSIPISAALLSLLFLLPALPAQAAGLIRRPPPPQVALDVVDREVGRILPGYRQHGQEWIAGEPGHRYAVRLRNLGAERVLVVLSVDGINAISGQSADPAQVGYVLGPWQSLEVAGWRKSLDAVAQFVFVDPATSYAARTGRPGNIGVIGMAVYRERPHPGLAGIASPPTAPGAPQLREERHQASRAAASEAAPAPVADAFQTSRSNSPSLGTGHGPLESARAHATTFDRQSRPMQLLQLRYDTRSALLARGIQVEAPAYAPPAAFGPPYAFPGGFVPDPR
jgi:hypothetical protein